MKLVVADDHRLVRDGLVALLQREPDLEVVAEAEDGHEAVRLCRQLEPDLLVTDLGMPGLNGVEVVRRVRERAPDMPIIAVSMHGDGCHVRRMLDAGALGYVLKTAASEVLISAVRTVLRGRRYVSEGVGYTEACAETRDDHLTPREVEILQLVSEGAGTREMAERMHLSPKTVETYRRRLMQKLGVDSVAGLVVYALRSGRVSLDSVG